MAVARFTASTVAAPMHLSAPQHSCRPSPRIHDRSWSRFAAGLAAAAFLLSTGCDVPTSPPNFEFTTGVKAPLLAEKTWVLIGPGDTGLDALIDTSTTRFDSLFTVDGADQTLALVQDIEGFDLDLSGDALPGLDLDPVHVTFDMNDLVDGGEQASSGVPFTPSGTKIEASGKLAADLEVVRLQDSEDYVQIGQGLLRIEDLINDFDVDFDSFVLSIPSLRHAPYAPADSLVIRFGGEAGIANLSFAPIQRRTGPRSEVVDLSDYRLYAPGNQLRYQVVGYTETANDTRTLNTSDRLSFHVRLGSVRITEVAAAIEPMTVNVSEDVDGDGRLDVLDEGEAQVATFDGLNIFGELDFDGFELSGTELRLGVRSNLGADVVLYAALLGRDGSGEITYLEGKGPAAVSPDDPAATWFAAGGQPLDPARLIRIQIQGAGAPDRPTSQTVVLNQENSNVDALLSGLPTEIRIASRLVVQPNGGRVHLREPFLLETKLGATIPLAINGEFNIDKTFDADLSGLEDVASDSSDFAIEQAELELEYANGLPFGVELRLDALDATDHVVASFPGEGGSLRVNPASTDDRGLAVSPAPGTFTLGLSRSDLLAMSRGERVRLHFALTTGASGRGALRATDTFSMRLRGRFRLRLAAE